MNRGSAKEVKSLLKFSLRGPLVAEQPPSSLSYTRTTIAITTDTTTTAATTSSISTTDTTTTTVIVIKL